MKHLFTALAAFQQEVPVIHKGTQGFGYSYADLPKIFEVINPLLKKHGLGFTQVLTSEESKCAIPYVQLKGMNDYQAFGSGVTYYRRYALSAALGLVTDKDTDASGEQVKKLPSIDAKRFQDALKAIADGKVTKEKITSAFQLTESQTEMLNAL
jgi:hypothetical protein